MNNEQRLLAIIARSNTLVAVQRCLGEIDTWVILDEPRAALTPLERLDMANLRASLERLQVYWTERHAVPQ